MPRSLACAALLFACASCALPSLEVQPRYGNLEIEGQAGFSTSGLSGAADLAQAGLDDDSDFSGRVDLEFGSPHLVFLGQSPSYAGDGTLDVTIDDGTNTINAGANVSTQLELEMYDVALLFDLVPTDTVEVALGFGAAYLDLFLVFEEDGTGTTITSDEAVPVPLLAGSASVWIGPVELSAFVGGVAYELDDDEVTYLDLDAFARWKLLGGSARVRGSLVGGWRRTDLEVEYDDDSTRVEADLVIQGPYLGLEFSL